MKLKHLLTLAALASPFMASAVPAYPGIIKQVNPDGTTVEIRLHGDEFFSYTTNTEGVLMQQNAEGYWLPVKKNGVEIMATPDVVSEMMNTAGAKKMRQQNEMQRVAALDEDGRSTYPTIGDDIHSLVVLMEYSDTKFTVPDAKQKINDWLNKEGYSDYEALGSVRDYYIDSSHGQFKPTFDVVGIVSLPETSKYYTGGNKYVKFYEAIKYAVNEIDDEVDFTKYDYDNDGVIDTIYFIYAGYGQADTGDESTVWPHQSTMVNHNITLDGKSFGPYATSNELSGLGYYSKEIILDGIGTFVHEYGHVLGLPDLYDPNYRDSAIIPSDWSTMDSGSYNLNKTCPPLFSGYEKWVCKWLDFELIEDNKHYEILSSDQENRAIKIPVYRRDGVSENKREFFILESRSNAEGWDQGLSDSGMLIWHIDYLNANWMNNSVNSTPAHPRVFLVTADGSGNPFLANYGAAHRAAWPGTRTQNTYITPDSEITLDIYTSGSVNDHFLTSIAFDAEKRMSTFNYNTVSEAPDVTTLMKTPNTLRNDRGRDVNSVRFYWDPVDGASGYQLTVYRMSSDGSQRLYVNNCNELIVGNVTQYDVANISSYLMSEIFYAYVRVIKELPSTEISNEISFIPDELTRVSGINDIEVDENAPVEYFNLQGVRVANPENGMFIRVQGGKATKVIVK